MYGCPVGCSMRARASRRRALLDRRRGRGRGRGRAVISCFSVALDSRTCKSASSIDIARSRDWRFGIHYLSAFPRRRTVDRVHIRARGRRRDVRARAWTRGTRLWCFLLRACVRIVRGYAVGRRCAVGDLCASSSSRYSRVQWSGDWRR